MRQEPKSHHFIYRLFELNANDIKLANDYGVAIEGGATVIARRNFDGGYGFEFPDFPDINFLNTHNPSLETPAENDDEEPEKGPSLWRQFLDRLPRYEICAF